MPSGVTVTVGSGASLIVVEGATATFGNNTLGISAVTGLQAALDAKETPAGAQATIAKHGVAYFAGLMQRRGWEGRRRDDIRLDLAAGEVYRMPDQ